VTSHVFSVITAVVYFIH